LFQEPTCYSVGDLAARLGISQRTAQRWLYDLDEIGCAVEMVKVGGRERYRGMRR
jgi:predicted DNA-binding transcriptional regulator YafY